MFHGCLERQKSRTQRLSPDTVLLPPAPARLSLALSSPLSREDRNIYYLQETEDGTINVGTIIGDESLEVVAFAQANNVRGRAACAPCLHTIVGYRRIRHRVLTMNGTRNIVRVCALLELECSGLRRGTGGACMTVDGKTPRV